MPRSRSARAHKRVLDAALKLFAADGIDATSMDAIAAASGVSKATIYNHWRDKDALCLEVLAYLHGLDTPPAPMSGDNRADLITALSRSPQASEVELRHRIMKHFIAYAAGNPVFAKAWRERVVQPRRVRILQVLRRSIAKGTLPRDLDLEVSVALLLGPMMYRQFGGLVGGRLPADLVEQVVHAFWRAYATVPSKKKIRPIPISRRRG